MALRACAPRSTRTTTSGPPAAPWPRTAGSPGGRVDHDDVGRAARPRAARRRRGPTPIRTGCCSRRKRRTPASSARPVVLARHDDHRPPGDPGGQRGTPSPCSSRSCSRRRNSVLLCVNVSSWVASPAGRAAISARPISASSTRPLATSRVADVDGALVRAGPLRRPRSRRARRRRRRRRSGRRPRPAPRARGSGSGPEIIGDGVDHGDDPGVDERLGGRAVQVEVVEDRDVAGAQPGQQVPGTAVDAGGADESGRCQRGRCRTVIFMTEPWCQPDGRSCTARSRARRRVSRRRGRLGDLEQLAGVGQRGVGVGQPGQHPGQLALALGVVEDGQARSW